MGLDLDPGFQWGFPSSHVGLNLPKALLFPFLLVFFTAKHIHVLLVSWGCPSSSG